jgi:hypothetical protein
MAMTAQTPQPRRGLTFEDVWAALMETREEIKETARQMKAMSQETDKKIQEMVEEGKKTDKKIQEMVEERKKTAEEIEKTDRLVKELSKNVGGVNGALGDMAEGLMASDLYETFAALGLDFDQSFQNYEVKDKKTKRPLAEVDKLLLNGTIALAVETKTTMTRGDVDEHETRMEILRNKSNSLFDKRKLYGAMAGVKTSKIARQYAIDKGFFVIELAGDTIKVNMPQGFKPKTW